ncbi:hypothetical protein AsAng_0040300 [Aureispira anguillae]|uniref:Uncharacterized protein n=1 Tax=Aureispira anguillae TaxID=2864201 RepID=A0A915YHI6_9BACT|nr:hypothetical protein AsAng_0040300 [Aureispira anguillae]
MKNIKIITHLGYFFSKVLSIVEETAFMRWWA